MVEGGKETEGGGGWLDQWMVEEGKETEGGKVVTG